MSDGYYIEKFYSDGSSVIEKCDIYNKPLLVLEEDKMYGFRFIAVASDLEYYSGIYYFGRRFTYNQLAIDSKKDSIKEMLFNNLERKGLKEVIVCDRVYKTFYDINTGDKTIEEEQVDYLVKSSRSVFINLFEFLTMIKESLEAHNNKVSIVIEDCVSKLVPNTSDYYVDDVNVNIREYFLFVDGYLLLKSFSIIKGKNTYIRLSDVLDLLKPLYQEYPYLECVLNNYMLDYFNNNKSTLIEGKKKKEKRRRR